MAGQSVSKSHLSSLFELNQFRLFAHYHCSSSSSSTSLFSSAAALKSRASKYFLHRQKIFLKCRHIQIMKNDFSLAYIIKLEDINYTKEYDQIMRRKQMIHLGCQIFSIWDHPAPKWAAACSQNLGLFQLEENDHRK